MQHLKIYRPVISNKITQNFGENKACVYQNGKITSKRNGVCPTGSVDFYKSIGMVGHNGTDIATWHGEPVFHAATFDGRMKIEKDFSGGIGVDVISLKPIKVGDYEGYVKCRYWHLKAPVGHDGKIVKMGETIGLADNTGASSGDHCHFNVKKCDKDGNTIEKYNGYNGAFNHEPYSDFSVDAKTAAEHLLTPPPEPSEQEKKEMISNLSVLRRLLIMLLEIKRRL